MKVSLISITPNAESTIAYCARVSSPRQDNPDSEKLIRYLLDHGHWSPLEMASMTVEIQTSRAISAQIIRHRSFSFQEFSQRYSNAVDFEPVELRQQAEKNRQSSTNVMQDSKLRGIVEDAMQSCRDAYDALIAAGVARECARMVLPMTTATKIYMTGNLRSWVHYIQLRTKPDTQKEHREIAEECRKIFQKECPTLASAAFRTA